MLQLQPNIQMQAIFNLIYPVGSLYFSTSLDTVAKVQSAFGGTWEKLPDGYAIWTASSGAGNTIAPGLPNITGTFEIKGAANGKSNLDITANGSGSFSKMEQVNNYPFTGTRDRYAGFNGYNFDASRSSSIYGASSTVQPPAYKVYAFRRTALSGGLKVIFASIILTLQRRNIC